MCCEVQVGQRQKLTISIAQQVEATFISRPLTTGIQRWTVACGWSERLRVLRCRIHQQKLVVNIRLVTRHQYRLSIGRVPPCIV